MAESKRDLSHLIASPDDVTISYEGVCSTVGQNLLNGKLEGNTNNLIILRTQDLDKPDHIAMAAEALFYYVPEQIERLSEEGVNPYAKELIPPLQKFHTKLASSNGIKSFAQDIDRAHRACKVSTSPYHRAMLQQLTSDLLTEDMAKLFGYRNVLLIPAPRVHDLVPSARNRVEYATPTQPVTWRGRKRDSYGNCVVIGHELIEDAGRGRKPKILRMPAKQTVSNALMALVLAQTDQLGFEPSKVAKRELLENEFRKGYSGTSKGVVLGDVFTAAANLKNHELLGSLNYYLHDGKHTEAQVRRDFPQGMAYYDTITHAVHKEIEQEKDLIDEELSRKNRLKTQGPPPPDPPTPPTDDMTAGSNPAWDRIWRDTQNFLANNVIRTGEEPPPYNLFRCRLTMEPGYPLQVEVSRWISVEGEMQEQTRTGSISLDCADLNTALDVKKRLQSEVLNTPPMAAHRRLHTSRNVLTEDDLLPDALPNVEPGDPEGDGQGGSILRRNGTWQLKLRFNEPNPTYGPAETVEVMIPLGLPQSDANRDIANARRLLILDELEHLHTQNERQLANSAPENVRRVTGQDLRLWLEQQVSTLRRLEEDSADPPPNLDASIQRLANLWHRAIPQDTAPQTWLIQQAHQIGADWIQAQTIDLSAYDFTRDIPVDFPPASDGEQPHTILHVQNPKLEGSPTPFWAANVEVIHDGKTLVTKRINLHISDGSGNNGDQDTALQTVLNRLNAALGFMKDVLEAYGQEYPTAEWQFLQAPQRFMQMTDSSLSTNVNMDRTRLDRVVAALPYAGLMTIDVLPELHKYDDTDTCTPTNLAIDANENVHFSLTFRREDGSQFQEYRTGYRSPIPVVRDFVMPAHLTPEETRRSVQNFAQAVQSTFTESLEEAFSIFRDPTHEPEGRAPAETENHHPQNVIHNIVRMLRYGSLMRAGAVGTHANDVDDVAFRLKPAELYRGDRITELFDNAINTALAAHLSAGITQETGRPPRQIDGQDQAQLGR